MPWSATSLVLVIFCSRRHGDEEKQSEVVGQQR